MRLFIIILIVIVIGLIAYTKISTWPSLNTSDKNMITFSIKSKLFKLEKAITLIQKASGLSNRTSLCENCGMIFIYSEEGIYPFWMKDTLIPLDMIWVNKKGEVVDIFTAYPEPGVPLYKLKNYTNSSPAKYIIELNANQAQQLNLRKGDILDVSKI